jgi:hypothetical protein
LHVDVVGAVGQADYPVVAVGIGAASSALPTRPGNQRSGRRARVGCRTAAFRAELRRQRNKSAGHSAAVIARNNAGQGDQWRQEDQGGDGGRVHGHVHLDTGRLIARGGDRDLVHACTEPGDQVRALVAQGDRQGRVPVDLRRPLGHRVAGREVDDVARYLRLFLARRVDARHFHRWHRQDLPGPEVELDRFALVAEQREQQDVMAGKDVSESKRPRVGSGGSQRLVRP